MQTNSKHILLTGATGYVGGRLLRALEVRGHRVRCLSRNPDFLRSKVGRDTEVVQGDVGDPDSLPATLRGIDTAYYLIHSMGTTGDYAAQDRQAAAAFAAAAAREGVRRIIYLGGLGEPPGLSKHLASRQEVGRILRESGVPTIEFRASIVIGSGSLSFEMIRALVEKLPIMVTPRWVRVIAQPIAIEDVIDYLVASLDLGDPGSAVFEIGGTDRVSYGDIMREYGAQRGLRRLMIPVPLLTPKLSSLWLGLVTPVYARVGRQLVDSLRNPTMVRDPSALETFAIRPRGLTDAIARALRNEDRSIAETRWSDALSSRGATPQWGESASAPESSTRGASRYPSARGTHSGRSAALVAPLVGTGAIGCGGCAAFSTCWWAAWAPAAAGGTRNGSLRETPSISGGWRRWNPTGCSGSSPK